MKSYITQRREWLLKISLGRKSQYMITSAKAAELLLQNLRVVPTKSAKAKRLLKEIFNGNPS
jgi:hypothetical protein